MVWASWSECFTHGKKLQNGEPGIIDRIKTVKRVDFRDFVKSWRTLDERQSEGEIQAVKEVLGIIQHLKSVWLEDCNLCEDHLRILHDVFEGVKIDDLFISKNENIGVEGWYYVGQIVLQSRVKELYASGYDVTDECLERFMQGMDGAQLDVFDISCKIGDSKNVDSINVLLKLLPLSCRELQLYRWELSEDQEVELQKKLDEDCHKSLTIIYGNLECEVAGHELYLKASPMKLPPILPGVEGLKARENNCSLRLEWNPLSIANVSYYIVVEDFSGKAVGEPIVTTDTSRQLSSLQSYRNYNFFIWGFTNGGISKGVAGIPHYTGKITETKQSPEPGTSLNKRKRTGDVVDTEASKGKKKKGKKETPKEGSTLSSWLATEGQYELPVGSQTSANDELAMVLSNDIAERNRNPSTQQTSGVAIPSTSGVIRATEASFNDNTAKNANPAMQRTSGVSIPRHSRIDVEKFILLSNATGTLYQGAGSFSTPVVPSVYHSNTGQEKPRKRSVYQQPHHHSTEDAPGAVMNTVSSNVQQTNIQQSTSYGQTASQKTQQMMENAENYHQRAVPQQTNIQQDTSYDQPATQRPQQFSTVGDGFQQPQQMMENTENYYQRAMSQQTNIPYDQPVHQQQQNYFTDDSVHQHPQQMMDNSTDQGFQQPLLTLLPETQSFSPATEVAEFTMLRTVNPSTDNVGVPAVYDYATGPSGYSSNVGQVASTFMDQTSNVAPDRMENRVSVIENTQTNFQQVIEGLEEDNRRQGEKIIKQDEKIAKLMEEMAQMKKEKEAQDRRIAELEQRIQGNSTPPQDENRNQLPFTLPMNSDEDVEENEKLLEEKQNGTKLVESLSDFGGDGKEAVWRVMGKLFSNALAQTYSWTGRKGKKPIRKLKMAEVIYRASIAKNVNNKDCEVAARRWLKNASDRDGGRKRRATGKKKAGKSGAGPSK